MGRKTSIKYRILRLALISVIVVVVVLLTVIALLINSAYNEMYKNEASSLASAYSQLIQANIENLHYDLDAVQSDEVATNESVSIDERKQRLKDLAATSHFKDFAIAYGDGKTYNDTDISAREYFQEAMNGKYYVSSPVIRLTDGSVTTMMAGPVFSRDGTKYVVYGGLDTMYFSSGLDSIDMGAGSSIIVFDKYGQVVASSIESDVMGLVNYIESEDEELKRFAEEAVKNAEGFIKYKHNGTNFLAAYQNIPDTDDWTICVSANFDELTSSILNDVLIGFAVSAVLMCLGIFISLKVANNIMKPLNNIQARLELLSEGDVSTAFVNDAPNDETRVLSDEMVRTIHTLRTYINDIRDVLGALANGDLTAKSSVEYDGDFVEIGVALKKITAALSGAFSDVKIGVQNIMSGAGSVAESAQSLSQTAIEESQAIAEISETIEKIQRQADNTAKISEVTSQLMRKTNENAQKGGELMKDLLKAVENIKDTSYAISNLAKTISDIAFQTNILALNASVEAARAGEAGKGFAVVAGEVRNLAAKSAEASSNTENLIKDSINAVDVGTKLAANVYEEINTIITDIDQVSGEIDRISSAAVEQKDSINLINSNISKIEAGMSTTTATAEENAASGQQLTSLSTTLSAAVEKYKLQ